MGRNTPSWGPHGIWLSCGAGRPSALTIFPKSQQRQARLYLCPGMEHLGAQAGTVEKRDQRHVITAIAPSPPRSFNKTLLCPILERRMLGLEGHSGSEQGHQGWIPEGPQDDLQLAP